MSRHVAQRTQTELDRIRTQIFEAADDFVDRVGALLLEAKELHPRGFVKWVEAELPFSYDTARRVMAVHVAYRELPAEKRAMLPRPWQALFAIRHHVGERMDAAVAAGEIGPATTVVAAKAWARKQGTPLAPVHSVADLLAGRLMAHDPGQLDDRVAAELARWLAERPSGVVPAVVAGV